MDGNHGVARRAEGAHGLVSELVPAARCADHGDDSSHNFTIPRGCAPIAGPLQCRPVRRPLLTLLALAALTFTTGLGRQAITDADEAYYAEASREMLASNDWLTPRFNFADRWQKPVLYYWMTAGAYTVAGVTEGAARFGAAMAGLGLALITWWVARRLHTLGGRRLAGRRDRRHLLRLLRHGALGAARPAAGPLHHASRSAPRLRATDLGPARCAGGSLAGAAAGCGFLMKGPVAVAVPAVVLLPVWWLERATRAPVVDRHPRGHGREPRWSGLPWYVAMLAAHGMPYLDSFFLTDNLERFTTSRFNEPRPLWFYPAVIAGGLLPWTLFAIGPAAGALVDARETAAAAVPREIGGCWLWAVAPTLFFMASVGQQPRYVLPVLPPLAILLAAAIDRRVRRAAPQPGLAGLGHGRAVPACWPAMLLRLRPVLDHRRAVGALGGGGRARGRRARLSPPSRPRGRWRALPAAMTGGRGGCAAGGAVRRTGGPAPGTGRADGARGRSISVARSEPVGPYRVFVRNLVFYSRLRQDDLFDEAAARRGFSSRPIACSWS